MQRLNEVWKKTSTNNSFHTFDDFKHSLPRLAILSKDFRVD